MTVTLTLLLTDVVDSTALAERLGDHCMAEVWSAHDRAARDLFVRFDGQEIDRTDGFLATFRDTRAALAFAEAFHLEMAALGARFGIVFQARIGVHRGEVILLRAADDDRARGAKPVEVEGLAKPAAARVMSIALGGQTLVSGEARRDADGQGGNGGEHGEALRFVSHGHYRMKGVTEPIELFEPDRPGAPLVPPPDAAKVHRVVRDGDAWRPAREIPHALPVARDAFVGRAACLREVARRIDAGARLVTLVGIGGAGKSRLAQQYARSWLGEFPGGAWFCDLSEACDDEGWVSAVAAGLGLTLDASDPQAQVLHAIRGRGRCLVVLDNCEQLTRAAGPTLARWLAGTRDACFLVTSREVLGTRGEDVYFLPALAPDDAAQLFRARAATAGSTEVLDDRVVRALVELLDRLPLALELAAARTRVMTAQQVLERMGERFRLLVSSGPPSRQSTLRATLDWSWELLGVDEQAALAQLSVFEGGFDLASAERVLALPSAWCVDVVQSLVDKSLLQRPSGGRFGMLTTVRDYAAEALRRVHGGREAMHRHGLCFAAHAEDDVTGDTSAHPVPSSERHRRRAFDLDNCIAAARRAIERGDAAVAAGAARAAWRVLARVGPFDSGLRLLEIVVAMPALAERHRVLVVLDALHAMMLTGRGVEAYPRAEALLAEVRAAGDDALAARLLARLGAICYWVGRLGPSVGFLEEALALAQRLADVETTAAASSTAAAVHCMRGDWDAAADTCQRACALYQRLGDDIEAGAALTTMGFIHRHRLEWRAAFDAFDASLAQARAAGQPWREAMCLLNMADTRRDAGNDDDALDAYAKSEALADACGDRRLLGWVHAGRGRLHLRRGAHARAAASLQQAEGLLRSVSGRVGLAKMLCSRAELDDATGERARAERALGEAREIAEALDVGERSELRRFLREASDALGAS